MSADRACPHALQRLSIDEAKALCGSAQLDVVIVYDYQATLVQPADGFFEVALAYTK